MPGTPSAERQPLQFDLYDYEGHKWVRDIETHIRDGKLPFDTLFRLASIGCYQDDPNNPGARLTPAFLHDIVDFFINSPYKLTVLSCILS